MQDLLNPNIRSIVHILNNWNFTFDGEHVSANLKIHITSDELLTLKNKLETELKSLQSSENINDDLMQTYIQAIFDLSFALNELKTNTIV